MLRKGANPKVFPSCGEVVKGLYKTWELIAHFTDKKMRITATIQACSNFLIWEKLERLFVK